MQPDHDQREEAAAAAEAGEGDIQDDLLPSSTTSAVDHLGDLDMTHATREQLQAFAAQLSASLASSLPDVGPPAPSMPTASAAVPASSVPPFDVPSVLASATVTDPAAHDIPMLQPPPSPPPAPQSAELGSETGLNSAAFSIEFARAAARSPSATKYHAVVTSSEPRAQSSTASVPREGLEMERDNILQASVRTSVGDSEEDSMPAKKKRKINKRPTGQDGASRESSVRTERKSRKPRRLEYGSVTAEIEDDTKTLEGIGRMWAANNDKKKRVPLLELFTRLFLQENYDISPEAEVSRKEVLHEYRQACALHGTEPMNDSALGRAVRAEFPQVGTRRLGKRGESAYYYTGIRSRNALPLEIPADAPGKPASGSRRRKGAPGKGTETNRDLLSSDAMPLEPAPPPAYSSKPPQAIVAKSNLLPYAISSTRSAPAGSSRSTFGTSANGSALTKSAATRPLRNGVTASAASSNMRTQIDGDEADELESEQDSMLLPPPAPPLPPPAPDTDSGLTDEKPYHHRGSSHEARNESPIPDGSTSERPSDVAASALFMLNQGIPPPLTASTPLSAATSAVFSSSSPPKRLQPAGHISLRGTASRKAGPQDRSQFPATQSVFAPRQRDPNEPPRPPRRKQKGTKRNGPAKTGSAATDPRTSAEQTKKPLTKAVPLQGLLQTRSTEDKSVGTSGDVMTQVDHSTAAVAAAAAAAAAEAAQNEHRMQTDHLNRTAVDHGGDVGASDRDGDEQKQIQSDVDLIKRSAESAAAVISTAEGGNASVPDENNLDPALRSSVDVPTASSQEML